MTRLTWLDRKSYKETVELPAAIIFTYPVKKPHIRRMALFDTTSSHLKALEEFWAAYRTRDMQIVEPLLAKDYRYKSLPDHPDLPEMTKEQHIQLYAPMFPVATKLDVRTSDCYGTAFKFIDRRWYPFSTLSTT